MIEVLYARGRRFLRRILTRPRIDLPLAQGLALESRLFAELFDTEDQKTGMRSFVENGPGKASFTGR
jgi:enoyl-CoA hydratase/carnithine racemase